jgi:hypothetical protein
VLLQKRESCFKDFPDQCGGCPEYREKRPGSGLPLVLVTGMGMAYPGQYRNVVIKECKLYHKRQVELLQ